MSKDVEVLFKPNGYLNRKIEATAKECRDILKEAKKAISEVGRNPKTIILDFGEAEGNVRLSPELSDEELARAMDLLMEQNPINNQENE